jgi:hypothetical protein
MSEFGSSVPEKKMLIIKNPDGTYSHCKYICFNLLGYKYGLKDPCTIENLKVKQISNQNAPLDDVLTISDSELQYVVNNYDQFDSSSLLEEMLSIFRRNQIIFFSLITIEMSMALFLLLLTWEKREGSIISLQHLYRDLSEKESLCMFYIIFFMTFILNTVFYPFGFYALITKKIKLMKYFTHFCLYSAIMTLFIIYLNM